MKQGTLWYRYQRAKDGAESWEFNHLEDGHCPNEKPTVKVAGQEQSWKGKWKKEFVNLNPNSEGVDQVTKGN